MINCFKKSNGKINNPPKSRTFNITERKTVKI